MDAIISGFTATHRCIINSHLKTTGVANSIQYTH